MVSRKKILCLFTLMLVQQIANAQGGFFNDPKSAIDNWRADIAGALNAAVAVFAIVGGFIIFVQYMQGNENAQKNFIKLVIGLAIFSLSSLIVNVFI